MCVCVVVSPVPPFTTVHNMDAAFRVRRVIKEAHVQGGLVKYECVVQDLQPNFSDTLPYVAAVHIMSKAAAWGTTTARAGK